MDIDNRRLARGQLDVVLNAFGLDFVDDREVAQAMANDFRYEFKNKECWAMCCNVAYLKDDPNEALLWVLIRARDAGVLKDFKNY